MKNDYEELDQLHTTECGIARDLMRMKNGDYAGHKDIFANLNAVESLSGCSLSCEQGILVRMQDKLSRLWQVLDGQAQVRDERIVDTCRDIINYSVLIMARQRSREEDKD